MAGSLALPFYCYFDIMYTALCKPGFLFLVSLSENSKSEVLWTVSM